MKLKIVYLIWSNLIIGSVASLLNEVVFIVMSQRSEHHMKIADETTLKLTHSLKELGISDEFVFDLQKEFSIKGGWTYFPLIPGLKELLGKKVIQWFVFLYEASEVNLKNLEVVLQKYDPNTDFLIGNLYTENNFTMHIGSEFIRLKFPDPIAGFIISHNVVRNLPPRINKGKDIFNLIDSYTTDANYQFSKEIHKLLKSPNQLVHDDQICALQKPDCAIQPRKITCDIKREDSAMILRQTLFAVKTFHKNHQHRLPILKQTWARVADNIIFASDVRNQQHGTIVVPGTEANTPVGHCLKTFAILKYFTANAESEGWKWLVITDDDTMLGMAKLMELLQCYHPYNEKIGIGERYGFRVAHDYDPAGFDYPAGGSGMIFNRVLVDEMMRKPNSRFCGCSHPRNPDDFVIGSCMLNIQAPLINSYRFHQGWESEYNMTMLEQQDPISFHRFKGMEDSFPVYNKWFKKDDDDLFKLKENIRSLKNEL